MDKPVSEAERQLLIALIELAEPIETPNNTHYTFYPKTLEEATHYFHSLRVDLNPAVYSLAARGLLEINGTLTEAGRARARQERQDHPPIWYWYREYYTITSRSKTYSRFCETLYGRDLCQTDFSDMAQLDFLIQAARIRPGDHVLDLGCGAGHFAEYLADTTGARVWGVDYTPEAIEQALERTQTRRDRLDFQIGNFDHLHYPAGAFDVITSIDTLYMPADLAITLSRLIEMLAPGGRLLVYYMNMIFDPAQNRDVLTPEGSDLGRAARALGLHFRTWDFTEPTFQLMRRKYALANAMRAEFSAEGTLFLHEHLAAESLQGEEPFDPGSTHLSRYLYEITRAGELHTETKAAARSGPSSPGEPSLGGI